MSLFILEDKIRAFKTQNDVSVMTVVSVEHNIKGGLNQDLVEDRRKERFDDPVNVYLIYIILNVTFNMKCREC